MKKIHKLLPAVALALAAADASAQLVYEPFNYTVGASPDDRLSNRTGGAALADPMTGELHAPMGASTTDYVTLANGSLTPSGPGATTGLAASIGNSVSFAGAGNTDRLALGPIFSSGSLFYSVTMQVQNLASMTTSPIFVAGFNNQTGSSTSTPSTIGTRIYLRKDLGDSTKYNIGTVKNTSTAASIVWSSKQFSEGDNVFVVGAYDIVGAVAGTDDVARMWLNPPSTDLGKASPLTAPDITMTDSGPDMNVATVPSIQSFVLRQAIASTTLVDELRVDRTWAGVTPPVGTSWNSDSDGAWIADSAKWSTAVSPNAAEQFVNFGAGISSDHTVTLDSDVTVGTMNFDNAAAKYNIAGTNTINMNGGTPTAGFTAAAAMNVYSGNHTVGAKVNLQSNLSANVASGSSLTVNGDLSGTGFGITKAGAGALILGGNNSYSGGTLVLGGTIAVKSNTALGAGALQLERGTLRADANSALANDVTIVSSGTVNTNGNALSVGSITGSGFMVKTGNGTLTAKNFRAGALTVNTGILKIAQDSTATGVSKTGAITITAGGKVDITNNKLITTSATGTWNGTAYDGVTGLVATGYSVNQDFSGTTGIVTSETSATGGNTLTNIGVANSNDILGGAGTWAGQSVAANSTLVMYTYGGDANLDGAITGDDYFQIDSAFPAGAHGWFNGDFNYDGSITGDDYFIIDSNFPAQGAPFFVSGGAGGVQAVPEPASMGLLGLATAGLVGRRRRRR